MTSRLGLTLRERSRMVVLALAGGLLAALAWALVRAEVGRDSRVGGRIDFDEASGPRIVAWLNARAAAGAGGAARDLAVTGTGRRAVSVEVSARSRAAGARQIEGIVRACANELAAERARARQRVLKNGEETKRLKSDLATAASRRAEIESAEANLLALDAETGRNALRLRHERLAAEHEAASAALAAARGRVASLRKSLAAEPPTVAFHPPVDITPGEMAELAAARRRLKEMTGRLEEMLKTVTELHPFAVKLSKEITAERARSVPLLKRAFPDPVMRPNRARGKLAAALALAEGRLAELAAKAEALGSEMASVASRLPGLDKLLSEMRSLDKVTGDLGAEIYVLEVKRTEFERELAALSASPPRLGRVVGPPELASAASGLGLAGGLAAGIVVAAAGLVAGFAAQRGFTSPKGLRKATGFPVLGAFSEEEIPYGRAEPPASEAGLTFVCAVLAMALGWPAAAVLSRGAQPKVGPIRLGTRDELPAPGDISPRENPAAVPGAAPEQAAPGPAAPETTPPEGATPEGGSPGTEAAPGRETLPEAGDLFSDDGSGEGGSE